VNDSSVAAGLGDMVGKPATRAVLSDSLWTGALRRLARNKIAVAGFFVCIVIVIACVCAPLLTKWDYASVDIWSVMERPSSKHILGTDYIGRDLFSRILYGGRVTLKIAFVSTALAAVIGSILGLVAGFSGGRVDFVLSHLIDVLAAIPMFLLIIAIEMAFGWGQGYFMYAMAIAAIPQFARLVRAAVMSVMGCEYIVAARALGVGKAQIVLRHILHNIAPVLITRFTSGFAEALLTCTVMGYLKIGISPPTPEWGAIVNAGKVSMRTSAHLLIIPCVVIIVCVLSVSLFGDGLRDALDPHE